MRLADSFRNAVEKRPLLVLLLFALITRIVAVIFSRGFGMHDDHFLVIEPAQAWADGINYQNWLPGGRTDAQPDGHSLLYSGLHYLIFLFFNAVGLHDPQLKMLFIRLLHALFSLLTVSFGYKITRRISGEAEAWLAGLLLAVFWFMPMLSVRNLVEIVCMPFIMAGSWYLLKADESNRPWWLYLAAGLVMGLGFSIRFQTAVFIGGTGLALLILKKWKGTLLFAAGVLAAILPVQGLIDYAVWGYPFAELGEYIRYNIKAAHDYITGPWYNYILLIAGILLPPVSLFLLAGFFKLWKKQLLLWLPAMLFLVFHSIFPNKQERFIFPILPFVVVLGVAGWTEITAQYKYWKQKPKLINRSWNFFWILNLILICFLTVSYSKRSRVEVMSYLSRYPDIGVILLEDTRHDDTKMVPQFYLGQWVQVYSKTEKGYSWYCPDPQRDTTDLQKTGFVLFYEDTNLDSRVAALKDTLPGLEYEASFTPGFIDRVMYRLNPVNLNQTIVVYRNTALFPEKLSGR